MEKGIEPSEDRETPDIVRTSASVNKRTKKKVSQPYSVIEKFNKAMELCRDMTTFLSTCGQSEFNEKLDVLNKSEWQCSQVATTDALLKEQTEKSELTPSKSIGELEKFKKVHKVKPDINIEANNKAETKQDLSLQSPV